MKAHEIVEQALKHMHDRASTYDRPDGERSIGATVAAFKAITGDGLMNTEERGWLFMMLLKAVRSQQGDYKADTYEDGTAYFALAGEAASNERATVPAYVRITSADWSKAPKEATHFRPEDEDRFAAWMFVSSSGDCYYEARIIPDSEVLIWARFRGMPTKAYLEEFIPKP